MTYPIVEGILCEHLRALHIRVNDCKDFREQDLDTNLVCKATQNLTTVAKKIIDAMPINMNMSTCGL